MPSRTLSEQEFNAVRDKVLASLPDGLDEASFQRQIGPRMEAALAEAENSPAPVEGGAVGRFLGGAAEVLNPVAMVQGIGSAIAHPIDTLTNIGGQMVNQGRQAVDLASQGRYLEAAGHAGAAALPVLGPMAAQAGEQIAAGDIAGGLGKGVGLVIPAATPAIVRGAQTALRAAPESAAAAAEAGAASRIADVMAPKVGPNKLRFGRMAEDVAPAIAKDLAADGAPWSRQGLHQVIANKLDDAAAQLDAVSDARLNARTFPTQPIIADLMAKRRALTAEAVDASKPAQRVTERTSAIVDEQGKPITVAEKTAEPIGKDVVPGPNAARVAQIDQAIAEIKQLGPVARYEPLRKIRMAYDGPAKAVYNPSTTTDFLKAQGGKLGAADVTGSLRDALAKMDPETAKANAPYSLYRTANDVLDATAEIQRVRPKVGRQIFSRMTGIIGGEAAGGTAGAAAGFIFAPIIDNAVAGGATTQLQTAALMQKLAGAIRRGDLGYVNSLSTQIKRLSRNAARQIGNTTSPSESQSPTTAPALATP